MDNLIKIVVGDWSGDGHNITDTEIIQTNLTDLEIERAYREACKIVGFDLKENCCYDYDDSLLRGDYVKKLRDAGINMEFDDRHEDPIEDEEDGVNLLTEEFVELYLEICKLTRPDFQYKFVRIKEVDIGGYGLCST